MNRYRVIFEGKVDDDIKGIDTNVLAEIRGKIDWLALYAKEIRHQALKGNRYKGKYKLRVGDYRVLYSISHREDLIRIEEIAHRSKIYKER